MRPLVPCVLCAVSSVVIQSIAYATGLYTLFAWASPAHAFSCLLLLFFLHPQLPIMLSRQAELVQLAANAGRKVGLSDIMSDPVLAGPQAVGPPPPWTQTCIGIAFIMLGDVTSGLQVATGSRAWAVVRELAFGSAALALLYGTVLDPAASLPPSRVIRAASWVVSCCIAASLVLDQSLLGSTRSASVYEDPFPTAAALRILACAAFAARCIQALLGSMSFTARYAVSSGEAPQHATDQVRLGLQLVGALLLLGPWVLPLILPGRHEALVLAFDRFATVALTLSGSLVCAPPSPRAWDEDEMDDDGLPTDGNAL